jgi:predicted PhzF superfamily epimerase YddE/YHI9
MFTKVKVNILRAFVDEKGKYGNPTGIVIDEKQKLSSIERQKIATKLHFTDTIFINNLKTVKISFFNPQQETKFAGDALINTSYFIKHVLGKNINFILCKGGQVKTWEENKLIWIEASLEGTPPWNHKKLANVSAVENITKEEALKFEHTMVWAWIDEKKGLIRSRTFLPDWGTLEDQGNGSGSMQLAKIIGKKIEIHQGVGSIIYSNPSGKNSANVGGRVKVYRSKFVWI